jgi:hypothetical protein
MTAWRGQCSSHQSPPKCRRAHEYKQCGWRCHLWLRRYQALQKLSLNDKCSACVRGILEETSLAFYVQVEDATRGRQHGSTAPSSETALHPHLLIIARPNAMIYLRSLHCTRMQGVCSIETM